MSTLAQCQNEFDFAQADDFEVARVCMSAPPPTCSCGTILATVDEVFSEECDACFVAAVEATVFKTNIMTAEHKDVN